jgi:hypothetical protein
MANFERLAATQTFEKPGDSRRGKTRRITLGGKLEWTGVVGIASIKFANSETVCRREK